MYDFHPQRNEEQKTTALPRNPHAPPLIPPTPGPHGAGSFLEEDENIGIAHLGGGWGVWTRRHMARQEGVSPAIINKNALLIGCYLACSHGRTPWYFDFFLNILLSFQYLCSLFFNYSFSPYIWRIRSFSSHLYTRTLSIIRDSLEPGSSLHCTWVFLK